MMNPTRTRLAKTEPSTSSSFDDLCLLSHAKRCRRWKRSLPTLARRRTSTSETHRQKPKKQRPIQRWAEFVHPPSLVWPRGYRHAACVHNVQTLQHPCLCSALDLILNNHCGAQGVGTYSADVPPCNCHSRSGHRCAAVRLLVVEVVTRLLVSALQAAKAAMKAAAGTLAEALAERDAAGDERASIEAQLQAALQSVAGDAATTISFIQSIIIRTPGYCDGVEVVTGWCLLLFTCTSPYRGGTGSQQWGSVQTRYVYEVTNGASRAISWRKMAHRSC